MAAFFIYGCYEKAEDLFICCPIGDAGALLRYFSPIGALLTNVTHHGEFMNRKFHRVKTHPSIPSLLLACPHTEGML